jgi:hypothetical protein
MTLIVGIKCSNGVVLGADSAATNVTSTGQRTSMQPTEKIDVVSDKILIGVSGSVGLAQLFKAEIEKLWNNRELAGNEISDAMTKLSDAIRRQLNREFQAVNQSPGPLQNLFSQSVLTQTLIALPIKKKPVLIEFTSTASPEEKNERLPTVAIGSAQPQVDPFLAFLRRIFWSDRLPTLAEGKIAAYWAIDYGIKSAPGGVGPPIKLFTLEKEGDSWHTHELSEAERNEIAEAVDGIEKYIRDFRHEKEGSGEADIKPPEPT